MELFFASIDSALKYEFGRDKIRLTPPLYLFVPKELHRDIEATELVRVTIRIDDIQELIR